VVRLSSVLADPDYAVRDLVRAIELDATLGGKLIRLANSPVYPGQPVKSVSEAIVRLGTGTVRTVAIAASAQPKRDIDLSCFDLTPDSYWHHCVTVLSMAEELMAHIPRTFDDNFTMAALLHDYGKLVLAKHLTAEQVAAINGLDHEIPRINREMRILSVNHAEVGAVVAQSWNLSDELVRAVQHHHQPTDSDDILSCGLQVANHLAWRLESRDADCDAEGESFRLSLQALGLDEYQLMDILERGNSRLEETLDVYS